MFDRDKSGFVDARELKDVLKSMGEPLTDDDIKEMMNFGDLNADGKLNYIGKPQLMYVFFCAGSTVCLCTVLLIATVYSLYLQE